MLRLSSPPWLYLAMLCVATPLIEILILGFYEKHASHLLWQGSLKVDFSRVVLTHKIKSTSHFFHWCYSAKSLVPNEHTVFEIIIIRRQFWKRVVLPTFGYSNDKVKIVNPQSARVFSSMTVIKILCDDWFSALLWFVVDIFRLSLKALTHLHTLLSVEGNKANALMFYNVL